MTLEIIRNQSQAVMQLMENGKKVGKRGTLPLSRLMSGNQVLWLPEKTHDFLNIALKIDRVEGEIERIQVIVTKTEKTQKYHTQKIEIFNGEMKDNLSIEII